MADRRPAETRVERDDGVVFTMRGPGGGAELPHDLVHALVEAELGVRDGIWGCVADGVVWRSMRHVSGRRPPHAGERSERLKRERAEAISRAEGLANQLARLASDGPALPGGAGIAWLPAERLAAATEALRAAARRWAALAPGDSWTFEWPAAPRQRAGSAGIRPADGRGRRRRHGGRGPRS